MFVRFIFFFNNISSYNLYKFLFISSFFYAVISAHKKKQCEKSYNIVWIKWHTTYNCKILFRRIKVYGERRKKKQIKERGQRSPVLKADCTVFDTFLPSFANWLSIIRYFTLEKLVIFRNRIFTIQYTIIVTFSEWNIFPTILCVFRNQLHICECANVIYNFVSNIITYFFTA